MNETPQIADNRTEENRIAGTLGAFLFALAGGLVYFALWQVGFIAAICGAIAVICAMKGYKLFAKKESLYGVVTSVVVSVLVIAIAWYFCLAFDVYDAYKEWYAAGEVEAPVSFLEALLGAHVFLRDPEIAIEYVTNLVIGIALCAVGCISPVRNAIWHGKKPAPQTGAQTENPAAPQTDATGKQDGEKK